MDKATLDLINLQGNLKIEFIRKGASEDMAHQLAAEALHLFATSDLIRPEHRDAYAELGG